MHATLPAPRTDRAQPARRPLRFCAGLCAVAAVGLLGPVGPCRAAQQDNQPQAESRPPEATTVFVAEHVALDKMLTSGKDQALAKALGMFPQRARELFREIPDLQGIPPTAVDLLSSVLSDPARIAVTFDQQNQVGGGFGVGVVISFGPMTEKSADAMQEQVGALIAQGHLPFEPVPSEKYKGMSEIYVPIGTIRFGPRKTADGWRYEVQAGAVGDPDAPFTLLPKPAQGLTPMIRGHLSLTPLTPLLQQFAWMAAQRDPNAAQGIQTMQRFGLFGPNALDVDFQYGHSKQGSVGMSVVKNMKQRAAAEGMGSEPLTPAELRMIPADARIGGLQRVNLGLLRNFITQMEETNPQVTDALTRFQATTGVNLLDDVLGSLGDTLGYYMADSTGGGSLGSTVLFIKLADRAKFEQAAQRLTQFANDMAAQSPAGGHVRLRSWKADGGAFTTLSFPGLPVPLELTYSLTGDWLIAGLTPQAAMVASEQAAGRGDGGLAANPATVDTLAANRPLISISFVDTARTMKDGYTLVSMLGSAVSNAMRSPVGGEREPGIIVPPYKDLAKGVSPMVRFQYFDGDDLVTESHGDESLLVNLSGSIGAASPFLPVAGALVGVSAAAVERQQMHPPGHWQPEW